MDSLVHDNIGLVHLVTSCLAVIAGTMVLAMRKGTRRHVQVGYFYVANMALLLITAFMLYNLFGTFGIFHYAAIISSLTLIGGMIPFIKKKPGYINRHFAFMFWSVIGLYAALASELFTRIPSSPFFGMVGVATGVIMIVANICWKRYAKLWRKQFARASGK
jgi:uncharacterized membrane protein